MDTQIRSLEAFRKHPELLATASHIVNVQAKLDRLAEAKRDSWAQILAAAKRLYAQRRFGDQDLIDLLADMKESYGVGYTKFWDAHMPRDIRHARIHAEAQRITYWRTSDSVNQPNGPAAGTWVGTFPLTVEQPTPRWGISVVYVLFDEMNQPAYVGSTEDFRVRVKTHQRDKPGLVRWMAYACDDREAAYRLEDRLLREHMPHMNKRRGR